MSTLEKVDPALAEALELAAIMEYEDGNRPVERGKGVAARLKSINSDGFATMRAAIAMGRVPSDPPHVRGCTSIFTVCVKACLENASSGFPPLTPEEWKSRDAKMFAQLAALIEHPSPKS